jgi:hypothetical protein
MTNFIKNKTKIFMYNCAKSYYLPIYFVIKIRWTIFYTLRKFILIISNWKGKNCWPAGSAVKIFLKKNCFFFWKKNLLMINRFSCDEIHFLSFLIIKNAFFSVHKFIWNFRESAWFQIMSTKLLFIYL